MSSSRRNSSSGSKRPLAILAILLACLLLIGVMGWQSWRLQQSNEEVAASVLRDYAALAADEFARRFETSLGYYGYSALIKRCRFTLKQDRWREHISRDENIRNATGLAKGFVWDDGALPASVSEEMEIKAQQLAERSQAMVERLQKEAVAEVTPYEVARIGQTGEQLVYAIREIEDNDWRVCGFVLDPAGMVPFAEDAIKSGPLLPQSLAGGLVSNDLVFIELLDPDQQSLIKINPQMESASVVDKEFKSDSRIGLAGFSIRTSLDPYSASQLVIGGLPKSRLPWLMAVLTMATLLLVTAIWLFRREQAVMALREDFVSQVSHELRTPLTQIRMFAETLLLDRARNDQEKHRALTIIDRESQRLSHLVENVLRVSKVSDSLQLDCQPQALAPILREVCDSVQSINNGISIELAAPDSIAANIDADALRQIVINLLDNAIKYGPEEHTIEVSLESTNESVLLGVQDQGPGIPAAKRDRIWDKFYRLDREKKAAISGAGIGLSVVCELADAMQAECRIDPSESGTRVTVEFRQGQDIG